MNIQSMRLKNTAFGFLVTALFFLTLEGAFFLAGVKPRQQTEDLYVGFTSGSPLFIANAAGDSMVRAKDKLRHFNFQSFPVVKASGAQRIFCLGGSTAYGRPYNDHTSFSAWLRIYLPVAAPGVNWEVINAGGISYASYRVAQLLRELVNYQPDLFVIYSGHNEFLEERTYRRLKRLPAAIREASALLDRTHVYSGMRQIG